MFYYYGRKKQTARHYPVPKFETIIEPFAGSAAYSLHGNNWEKAVFLIEKNPEICSLWRWLIETASKNEIEKLPELNPGERLSQHKQLTDEQRLLMSLHIIPGATSKRDMVGRFSRWGAGKRYIANNLHKIKHWAINCGDYTESINCEEATYFIDPPYRSAGKHYAFGPSQIDYGALSIWVMGLKGQIIVCEGENHGGWLDFSELEVSVQNGGMNKSKKSKEYVFTGLGQRPLG